MDATRCTVALVAAFIAIDLPVIACSSNSCEEDATCARSGQTGLDASADGATPDGVVDGSSTKDGGGSDTGSSGEGGADAGPLAELHFTGRVDRRDVAGPRFAWPGTQVRARFSGTGVSMRLHDTGSNQFAVSIDGASPTVVITSTASDQYPLATGLTDAEHDLVITKRTETFVGTAQLFELTTPEKRALIPTPAPFSRLIEFVGDSVTCGYGVLGASSGCTFSAGTEAETLSYAALTANALSAGHVAIAYSGVGMYRDSSLSTTNQMPARYALTLADDATSTWDFSILPDVVVIQLGGEDYAGGDPGAPLTTAYTAFLAALRGHYPTTPIVAALPTNVVSATRTQARTAIQAAVSARTGGGDTHVTFFEFDEQVAADGYGCDFNPSQTTQQKISAKLVDHIKTVTGW